MNERDKELSLAIDALTEVRYLLHGLQPIAPTSRIVRRINEAIGHVENASEMPRSSRIRQFVQRLREAA